MIESDTLDYHSTHSLFLKVSITAFLNSNLMIFVKLQNKNSLSKLICKFDYNKLSG